MVNQLLLWYLILPSRLRLLEWNQLLLSSAYRRDATYMLQASINHLNLLNLWIQRNVQLRCIGNGVYLNYSYEWRGRMANQLLPSHLVLLPFLWIQGEAI